MAIRDARGGTVHGRPGRAFVRLLALVAAAALSAAVFVAAGTGPARGDEDDVRARAWKKAITTWNLTSKSPLDERFEAVRLLAATGDPRALAELLEAYRRPGDDPARFRELAAPQIARAFADVKFAPDLLVAFTTKLAEPEHAWLVLQVAGEWTKAGHAALAVEAFDLFEGKPLHRAAALRGLAWAPSPEGLDLARRVLGALPEEKLQRALLMEGAARVVEANAAAIANPKADVGVQSLIAAFEHPTTSRRSKTIAGRALAGALKSPVAFADADSWRQFLDDAEIRAKLVRDGYAPSGGHTYFFGMPLVGRDVVYVIDVSGSMGQPLRWRPDDDDGAPPPEKGPTTGAPPKPQGRAKRTKPAQDALDSVKSLPWDKINTRIDGVREALKASLRSLAPDQRFAVVVFSTEAEPLEATRRLVPATKQNVANVCDAVDRMSPGGNTNIHRGLELAFGLSCGAQGQSEPTGVDPEVLLGGADTIVLLTDGAPTHDNYSPRRGTNQLMGDSLYANYHGGFEPLLTASRRWNAFLDAEVCCVGISGAIEELLSGLARDGRGRTKFLGE